MRRPNLEKKRRNEHASLARKSVTDEIAAERHRQVEVEGWSYAHDDQHRSGELAGAGAAYAMHAACKISGFSGYDECAPDLFPFEDDWWKPKNPRRDLIRAAALIVAEIERLDRALAKD